MEIYAAVHFFVENNLKVVKIACSKKSFKGNFLPLFKWKMNIHMLFEEDKKTNNYRIIYYIFLNKTFILKKNFIIISNKTKIIELLFYAGA